VTTLGEILAAPGLAAVLHRLAGPVEDRSVSGASLVEDLDQIAEAGPGALVVLTAGASRSAAGYRLDMALRLAGARSVAAIVLTDGRREISTTARTIADRAAVDVLTTACSTDLAALVLALERELAGGSELAFGQLGAVLDAIRPADEPDLDGDAIVVAASTALGHPLQRTATAGDPADHITVPITIEGGVVGFLGAARRGGHLDTVTEVAVRLVAAAVARFEAETRLAEEVPVRSRGELLTEFLLAGPDRADRLLQRLRAAGIGIDGWHAVIRIEGESLETLSAGGEVASFHLRQQVGTIALQSAQAAGGHWHRAQVGSALLLVKMERQDSPTRGGPELTRVAANVLADITARTPDISLVCGVGSLHQGPTGLRASAAEAHVAVAAARAAHRRNVPVSFDGVGLQRTLIEWYASDTAREMVDSLLEPLDRLGGHKAESAIRTLQVYLDTRGSLARTAEQLHLHRNAVSYRVQRIFSALDVDASDPDTRLMLQLACRARLLR